MTWLAVLAGPAPGAMEVDARLSPPFEALLKELTVASARGGGAGGGAGGGGGGGGVDAGTLARGAALFTLLSSAAVEASEAPSTTAPVAAYSRSIDGAVPAEGTSEERGDAAPAITAALPSRRRLVYLPPGKGGIENKHSTDFKAPRPPPRVCMLCFTRNVSYSPILVQVLVLNDPPARGGGGGAL